MGSRFGMYFASVFEQSETEENFIQIIKNNGSLYMYSDEQLKDVWEALCVLNRSIINKIIREVKDVK